MKYISKKLFIVPIVSLLISVATYPNLPAEIPVHFDFHGVPDNYEAKWFVFVIPLLSFVLTALADVMPKMDPKSENYARFPKAYELIHWLVNLVLLGANVFIILFALGYQFNMGFFIAPTVGLMFVILGNYMPKFKQSFFCGIKTPWALADEENWYMTHRFGGKLWMVGGILLMIIPFLPESFGIPLLFTDIVLMTLAPFIYSYLIFRKKQQ